MVNLGAEFNPLQNLTLEQFSEEVLRETTITIYDARDSTTHRIDVL